MSSQNVMAIQAMLIDSKQFRRILRIEKTAFYEWKKRDTNFPEPIRFSGGRTVRYRLSDAMKYANLQQSATASELAA